jgi:hypothetical protein
VQGLEPEALSALLAAASCLTSLKLPPLTPSVAPHKQDIVQAIRCVLLAVDLMLVFCQAQVVWLEGFICVLGL